MADAGVGEAMLAAEVLGEVGTAEAGASLLGADVLGTTLGADALGTALGADAFGAAALPEAFAYNPVWSEPIGQLASNTVVPTMTDVVPSTFGGGPEFIDIMPPDVASGEYVDRAIAQAGYNYSPSGLVPADMPADVASGEYADRAIAQAGYNYSPSGLAPADTGAGAEAEFGSDPFGQRGMGPPESRWYDMFFKPGGPNTGGITDFWKSMNMAGQAGTLGLGALAAKKMLAPKYGVPAPEKYTGPLSYFKYDPRTYRPDVVTPPQVPYRAQYAEGGIAALARGGMNQPTGPVERMSQNIVGAGGMYPQSQMDKTYFATPTQMPASAEVISADYDAPTNPYTGAMMASGGITSLGGYSDGGRMLKGPGDGMSDSIPGTIAGKQPARLADGEFVVPADVVSHLGNGSTDAGAKKLYGMMDKVRKARTGTKKQGKQINPNKYMPA